MSSLIFVDVQGFKDDFNRFIIKEFAISSEEYTKVLLVRPPFSYTYLTKEEKKRVQWIQKHRGITWNEGSINYKLFKRIVTSFLENKKIIVKGLEKMKWIKELCDTCYLINIEDKSCPNFKSLHKTYRDTAYNCIDHKKECALKNVICIKKWYFDNCVE